jgi:hypothetical protein
MTVDPAPSAEKVRPLEQCPECLFVWDEGDETWHDSDCPARIDGRVEP